MTSNLPYWRFASQLTTRGLTGLSMAVLVACGGGGGSSSAGSSSELSSDAQTGGTGSGTTQDSAGSGGATGGSAGSGGTTQGSAGSDATGSDASRDTSGSAGHSTASQPPTLPVPPVGARLNAANCQYRYLMPEAKALGVGTDLLLSQQWHLSNNGQSGGTVGEDLRTVAAWQAAPAKGAGIRIAIIDDAVEVTHDDLAPNVDLTLSRSYRTNAPYRNYPLPCESGSEHGTAVAGVAAARDGNGLGVAGVAPRATLVAYDAIYTRLDSDIADALTRDLAAVEVYNNSWGLPDNGTLQAAPAIYRAAIQRGLREGRGGRGAIYLFAAGNGGCYYSDGVQYGIVPTLDEPNRCNSSSDNSNFDGFTNQFGVIPVCAVNDEGRRPWYGERGANVLVCGLSSDRGHSNDDSRGYVTSTTAQNQYTSMFSGTSASTPQVSGVVAMMLEQRPELTWRDVRLILASTARKNDPFNPGWSSANALNHHPDYGFGTVDASAAIARARTWTSVGDSSTLTACRVLERRPALAIPDAPATNTESPTFTPVVDTLTVSSTDCPISRIEWVQVTFSSDHSYGGDLKIELISPNGLVSELANSRLCYQRLTAVGSTPANARSDYATCRTLVAYADRRSPNDDDYSDGIGGWTFSSARHLDEGPTGTWQLRVTDEGSGDWGNIVRWKLAIWGR